MKKQWKLMMAMFLFAMALVLMPSMDSEAAIVRKPLDSTWTKSGNYTARLYNQTLYYKVGSSSTLHKIADNVSVAAIAGSKIAYTKYVSNEDDGDYMIYVRVFNLPEKSSKTYHSHTFVLGSDTFDYPYSIALYKDDIYYCSFYQDYLDEEHPVERYDTRKINMTTRKVTRPEEIKDSSFYQNGQYLVCRALPKKGDPEYALKNTPLRVYNLYNQKIKKTITSHCFGATVQNGYLYYVKRSKNSDGKYQYALVKNVLMGGSAKVLATITGTYTDIVFNDTYALTYRLQTSPWKQTYKKYTFSTKTFKSLNGDSYYKFTQKYFQF